MRALTGFLSGTTALFLALSPAVAEEAYSPDGGRTEIRPPDTTPARPADSAVEMLTGRPAMDHGGVPFAACPDVGGANFEEFAQWFRGWTLAGTFGYVMYPTGPGFKIEQHTLTAGESRSFFIGDAVVKKFAWCMFPTAGDVDEGDVTVTTTTFGTDAQLCDGDPTPCALVSVNSDPALNHLYSTSNIGYYPRQYVVEVTGPETGAVTIFIGGRLGTYPTLGLATN